MDNNIRCSSRIYNTNIIYELQRIITIYPSIIASYSNCRDVGYWYTERPNVSLLAGAAWKLNYFPIEEYSAPKRYINNQKQDDEYKGRIDIKIVIPEKDCEIIFEAKHTYSYLKDLESVYENAIQDCMTIDVKSLPFSHAKQIRCGVLFNSICFYENYNGYQESADVFYKDQNTVINDIISTHEKLTPDAIAWCFPELEKDHIHYNGYLNVGIVTSFKQVD